MLNQRVCLPYGKIPQIPAILNSPPGLPSRQVGFARGRPRFAPLTVHRYSALSVLAKSTSSPGSSRFSIWRRLGRRPWHTAEHVTKISNEDEDLFSKWRPRRKGWEDLGKRYGWGEHKQKWRKKAEVQFKKKKEEKQTSFACKSLKNTAKC